MTSEIRHTSVDCAHPFTLAQFWSAVLDRPVYPDSDPDDTEVGIDLGGASDLLFLRVPETKSGKNRLHLCLRPTGAQRQQPFDFVLAGAGLHDDRRQPDGTGWAVLNDPEGNEFCVLRGTGD